MYMTLKNSVDIVSTIMESFVRNGDVVVDATLGNGNDSLKLAKLVGPEGKVYSFDIQLAAIEASREKLEDYANVSLINDSHADMLNYIDEGLDFVVYNLGYLPGGDKTITTKAKTTISSLSQAMELLRGNAIIALISYIGHSEGSEENMELELFFSKVDQKKFNILKMDFINQINKPPIVYLIEKNKE